jgi:hemerythrin superfamily protein
MLKRKLAKHAMAEEDIVYPELHAQPDQADRSKRLYDQHADMKIRLFQLEELVKSGGNWSEQVRSLRDLVQRHADEEEQNVFPQLRSAMTENRMPKVSGQIHREEAMVL